MNLRLQAAADLVSIMGDVAGGFAWPITVTPPGGVPVVITGFSTDIGESLDPETGMLIAGRKASVAIPIASLVALGIATLPAAVPDASKRVWKIQFADIGGKPHTFAVKHAMPDTAIGVVTCILEVLKV